MLNATTIMIGGWSFNARNKKLRGLQSSINFRLKWCFVERIAWEVGPLSADLCH